jgi:phosphopantetheine adenylyltransferase
MDQMKDYKQLIKELPSKTVVFAFGRFNPPTIGHELLVKAVKKLAQQKKADHVIYASKSQDAKKNPLSVDKKVKYLKLMFKSTNFAAASEEVRTFIEAAKQLNKKYKNIVMVAGSDRVPEFNRLLNTYNGKEFNFDTIEVISAGERDPDADDASGMSASKMRSIAVKGNYAEFKKGLPSTVRDIDGKRLMNDIREGMGLEPIKEQIVLVKDVLREQYFRGEIFNEGDIVESSGEKYTIVKRGSNHLLLKESTGKLVSKWIQDVKPTEEKEQMNEELTDKTLKPNDKIKVARVIATMLGVENAETSSNPETLINTALRKVRTKALNPEGLSILDKMLTLATSVGINYDTALKPSKLKEGVMQSNGTDKISTTTDSVVVNPKSKYNFAKDVLRFNDFKKLKKVQEQHKGSESQADHDKDNESDVDADYDSHKADKREVGHTLVSAGGQDNLRRRKVKYHLGEETGMEVAAKIQKKGMTSFGKESGHENTAMHIATNPEHTAKQKKLALSFMQKMQSVSEATTPADKAAKETAKANLVAKHAAEKEALATKHAREKDSLSEAEYRGKGAGHPGWMLRADPKLALALKKAKERKKFVAGTPSKEYMDKIKTNESLEESHVEFRLDHRDKVTGDHKSTFADHEAKVSDTTDKATYVKVPSHKADSFKSAMKSKHGVRAELAEEVELNEGAYEKSEENKRSADAAKKQGDMFAHHLHMSDYHDNLAQWHSEKGRHSVADTHAAKSEEHHEKAMSLKEAKVPSATGDLKDACWKGYTAVGMKTKNGKKVPNCVPVNEEELDEEVCPVCGKEECECEKPEAGPVTTDKPFDPMFKEDEDEIEFPEMSDDEIDKMADDLSDDDYLETYDDDELGIIDDETGEELEADEDEEEKLKESKLMEVLSRVERMKAKARIRRTKAKRERATKIALKRYSNTATINKRARRLAVKLMKQRLLRGRDPSKISVGEKERIERTLERRKAIIGRVAMRLAPRVRKIEKARLSHSKYTQGAPNVAF